VTGPRRVVVAGYGMAAARLAEEIRARDPLGHRVSLTIAGAEPCPAYNRVLLSSVLAGRVSPGDLALHPRGWARAHRVLARCGVPVASVRPGRHQVVLSDGSVTGYDDLVLATGSRPVLPPLAGLEQAGGAVTPFRTLGDCRRIMAAAGPGARVAVLGGGLLGLEAARGLAARGAKVTVAHAAPHLMERQLDRAAARIVAERLRGAGVVLHVGVPAEKWSPACPGERGGTLWLADGTELRCDLVVTAAGVRAETGLAQEAGLATDRGILVDGRLATSDPRIYAIGDCAQHPGAVAGLLQPAWDQAAVLAALLTGADPDAAYHGTPNVTRLKADVVELTSLGDACAEDTDGTETLRFDDPARGRYAKLSLRGDRVTGAIMLGLPDAAASVIQLYDRGTPAPSDRLALLLGRALPPEPGGAGALPDTAVVCRCNTVTKGALAAAWRRGARSVPALAAATRATTGCGGWPQGSPAR
jgi:assimilatory nitrate reductase electron transfer subunit